MMVMNAPPTLLRMLPPGEYDRRQCYVNVIMSQAMLQFARLLWLLVLMRVHSSQTSYVATLLFMIVITCLVIMNPCLVALRFRWMSWQWYWRNVEYQYYWCTWYILHKIFLTWKFLFCALTAVAAQLLLEDLCKQGNTVSGQLSHMVSGCRDLLLSWLDGIKGCKPCYSFICFSLCIYLFFGGCLGVLCCWLYLCLVLSVSAKRLAEKCEGCLWIDLSGICFITT